MPLNTTTIGFPTFTQKKGSTKEGNSSELLTWNKTLEFRII
jgi:hypothetical protein